MKKSHKANEHNTIYCKPPGGSVTNILKDNNIAKLFYNFTYRLPPLNRAPRQNCIV